MKARKTIGILLLVLGILLLLLFAIADILGIGVNPDFGVWQITGTLVGAIVAIIGLVMLFKKKQLAAGNPPNSQS
jgi:hypothetical protein